MNNPDFKCVYAVSQHNEQIKCWSYHIFVHVIKYFKQISRPLLTAIGQDPRLDMKCGYKPITNVIIT